MMPLRKIPYENIVGKGENTEHQPFLLFPQVFLVCERQIHCCKEHSICRMQMSSILIRLETYCLMMGYKDMNGV